MAGPAVISGAMNLVRPALPYILGYSAALRRGWSPDNTRDAAAAEELQMIADDAMRFLEGRFRKPSHYGNAEGLLYRIYL